MYTSIVKSCAGYKLCMQYVICVMIPFDVGPLSLEEMLRSSMLCMVMERRPEQSDCSKLQKYVMVCHQTSLLIKGQLLPSSRREGKGSPTPTCTYIDYLTVQLLYLMDDATVLH